MNNLEAAWSLNEIADLLEIKGENQYKIRAYRKAAASIANLGESLETLHQQGLLLEVPGVGKNIAGKLEELLTTGKISLLERLRQEISPGLRNITQLPGVGLRAARIIYQHTGISDLEQLEQAARDRKIRSLPGLGPKTELSIIRGIEILRAEGGLSPINLAMASAEILVGFLNSLSAVDEVAVSGSLRRGKEMVHDVDIVASSDEKEYVLDTFAMHPHLKEIVSRTEERIEAVTWLGVKTDLTLTDKDGFIPVLHWGTGSKEYFKGLSSFAQTKGVDLKVNQVISGGIPVPLQEESEIYRLLELPYIPPEIREDPAVIEAGQHGKLPALIELNQIKGDLHIHSTWSDGISTIEEMVKEAIEMNYSYIAITDHSKALAIANGLSWERLQQQWKEIERLQYEYAPFRIFKGLEVDILNDGILDYEDEVLERLDVVIASVHSGFRQDSETLTGRLVAALCNPYVDIVAHPTGRILGKRPPYNADFNRFFEVAAETGTFLEINASPDRLDLSAEHARQAKDMGIMIAISTDAHEKARLKEMAFGVTNGRRGWLEASNVINSRSVEDIEELLETRRARALSKKGSF